jgi:membrane protein YfhO
MPATLVRAIPYAVLLAEVLVFWRRVLFSPHFIIPYDLPGFHLPLAHFIVTSLRQGQLPLWNPYSYCGSPFFANIQTQLFYPPAWIALSLGTILGPGALIHLLAWQIALHIVFGGVCTYWLLRRLRLGTWPSLLGATIFQLGGFFATQSQHIGAANGGAWLPLMWLSLLTLAETFTWRWTAILAIALSMTVLTGFPALTVAALATSALLACMLVLWRRAAPTLLVVVMAALLWAGLLASVQLLPTMQLAPMSTSYTRGEYADNRGGAPFQTLVSVAIPNYYNVFQPDRYQLPWNATFLYVYCGLAGLLLALAALYWRDWRPALFGVLTFVSAFAMMGGTNPIGRAVLEALPGRLKSPIYPEFAMPAFILGMAILAALGAERFVVPRGNRWAAVVVAITAVDLIAVGSNRWFNTQSTVELPGITHEHFDGSRDLLTEVRRMANSTFPPSRIDIFHGSPAWGYAAPLTGVPTDNGDDPLALSRLLKVRALFAEGLFWLRNWEVSKPDSPLLDLLNIRFLLSRPQESRAALQGSRYHLAATLPGTDLFENSTALPRFFLVGDVRKAGSLDEAAAIMTAPGFDARRTAIIEGDVSGALQANGTVRVVEYRNNRVVLDVESGGRAFLVSSETQYPGWTAEIDDIEHPIVMTNVAFRGLVVPAGRHAITMQFRPSILWQGIALSAAGWALIAWAVVRRPTMK